MEEKKVKRAKGNRKVIISGVLAGALLFASVSEINLTKNEIKADAVSVKADITKELTEKRNSFVKQFALSDGSFTAVAYSMPVHYKKKGGETEYCLRLIPIGGFVSLAGEDADDNSKIPKERMLLIRVSLCVINLGGKEY